MESETRASYARTSSLRGWVGVASWKTVRSEPRPRSSERVGVDAVALVGELLAVCARVADDHPRGVRYEQIVEPLGLRPFVEGHVQVGPGAAQQGDESVSRGLDDPALEDDPGHRAHGEARRCLVDIDREILRCCHGVHGARSFLARSWRQLQFRSEERAFNMR
jgi:hypothetical protein